MRRAIQVRTGLAVQSLQNNVENLTFTNDNAHLGVGNALGNIIVGGLASDDLFGRDGNDVLRGGTGAANTLLGQQGDDLYIIEASGDSVIEFLGEGIDTVQTALGAYTLSTNVENLVYTGTGAFTGIGNGGDNSLQGGLGDDFLSAMGGNDVITSGSGNDLLLGGAGADTFRFAGGETGSDRILDFTSGSDRIALSGTGFVHSATIGLVQGPGALSATSANSSFIYDQTNGHLSYDADGNGAGAAVLLATLNAGLTLSAGDFVFY
jgi:Ca2+-binding RTX toxin-like protein